MRIEFYGVLRELAGAEAMELPPVPGETVGEALARLARQKPALAPQLERAACAVGDTLVRRGEPAPAAEPLVLLPPVSGG